MTAWGIWKRPWFYNGLTEKKAVSAWSWCRLLHSSDRH